MTGANTSCKTASGTTPDPTESVMPDSMVASSLSISDIMLPANPSAQPHYQATFTPSLPDATLPANLAHSIETLADFTSIDPSYGVNMLAPQSSTSLVEELSYDNSLLNGVQTEHTPPMLPFKPDVPSLSSDPSVIDSSLSFDFSAIDSFDSSFFTSRSIRDLSPERGHLPILPAPTVAPDTPISSWNRDVAAGNLPFISPPRFRGALTRIGSNVVQSAPLPTTAIQPTPLSTMALQVATATPTPMDELGVTSDQALNDQTRPTTVQPAPLPTMAPQVATAVSTPTNELGAMSEQPLNDQTRGMNVDDIMQPLDDIVNEPRRSARSHVPSTRLEEANRIGNVNIPKKTRK